MFRVLWVTVALTTLGLPAFAREYLWVGKSHACVVEEGVGLKPGERDIRKDAFIWENVPKSLRIDVQYCVDVPPTQKGWGTCTYPTFTTIRTPGFEKVVVPWSSNNGPVFNTSDGETMVLEANGRFQFAKIGFTKDTNDFAWFAMTGTCSPFGE